MEKEVISSREFIDRFVECLEKGEDFKLKDCVVEGNVDILNIYEMIKDKELKGGYIEKKDDEIVVNINIKVDIYNVEFNGDFRFFVNMEYQIVISVFNGNAYFRVITFKGSVYFIRTIFNGDVDFIDTIFEENAYFSVTAFKGNIINFSGTIFNKESHFKSTTFEGNTYFSVTTFNIAEFYNSTFKSHVYFDDISFNLLSFTDCRFRDDVSFKKIDKENFKGLAIFLKTQFLNKHTTIENFQLSKTSFLKTDVREVLLCDVKKEEILSHKILRIKEDSGNKDKDLENKLKELLGLSYKYIIDQFNYKSVLAEYRNLRISIENNRTYIEASNLYKMEMELIKEFSNGRFEKFIIGAYGAISDYGESMEKTGKWILGSMILFTILASILRFKGMEWDIFKIIEFWWISFWEVIRLFLQIGTEDKSLWILEPIIRVTSLILLGNLYIAVRRKLSRK